MFEPRALVLDIEDGVLAGLQQQAYHYEVSLASVVLTSWFMLLGRLIKQEEIVVGVAGSGRTYEELSQVLGLFTRYLPVRLSYEPQRSLEHIVRVVDRNLRDALSGQLSFSWASLSRTEVEFGEGRLFPFCF